MKLLSSFLGFLLISCAPAVKKDSGKPYPDAESEYADDLSISFDEGEDKKRKYNFRGRKKKTDGVRSIHMPQLRKNVKVLLSSNDEQHVFNSFGRVKLVEIKEDSSRELSAIRGEFTVKRVKNGFKILPDIGEGISTQHFVKIIPLRDLTIIDIDGSPFRGALELRPADKGKIVLINDVAIEDYLRGVLPYEMRSDDRSILEALKAQAIAARTYVYQHLDQYQSRGFDVYSTVKDQVYKGSGSETFISDKAVSSTKHLIMVYEDKLASAYYHSTCGGRTSNITEVWGGKRLPYLVSVSDIDEAGKIYCKSSSFFRWFEKWDRDVLTGVVKKNQQAAKVAEPLNFSELLGINIRSRTSSGRVKVLEIKTDKGDFTVKGDKTRWLLRRGYKHKSILFSAAFEVQKFGEKVLINGRGNGHGIGMCQTGAMNRARQGQKYTTILLSYYTGVEIAQVEM